MVTGRLVVGRGMYCADAGGNQLGLVGGDVVTGPVRDDQRRVELERQRPLLVLPLLVELLGGERSVFGRAGSGEASPPPQR